MGLLFKDKIVVGVSITPGVGIEIAQIDYEKHLVVNYISKPFAFDSKLDGGFDLDIFKDTLYDALVDMGIPQGSKIVLNIPSTVFAVRDWPAAIDTTQLPMTIESDLYENTTFKDISDEPLVSYYISPNSTVQFNKVVYTAVPKSLITEIALQIWDLKYQLVAIDTTVNSTLNALMYTGRIEVAPTTSWVMLLVDDSYCRIISMQGNKYVDCVEENISIGSVLEDKENYDIVLHATESILKNIPSSLLYVVSKTDVISAEKLASKISYKSQIVYQEANSYNPTPLIDISVDMNPEVVKSISLDVIGAAVKYDFGANSPAPLNLFNKSLGDVYTNQVPPMFMGYALSVENMIKLSIILAVSAFSIILVLTYFLGRHISSDQKQIKNYEAKIAEIDKFLEENKDISAQKFSEYDEVRMGLNSNKKIYSYYTIVGTEIPQKLWLTSLKLGDRVTIEGQADNLESVYSFFRNIRDYNPGSQVKLQRLGLAGKRNLSGFTELKGEDFDTESILTSMNADFYEFRISDDESLEVKSTAKVGKKSDNKTNPPDLEPLE